MFVFVVMTIMHR